MHLFCFPLVVLSCPRKGFPEAPSPFNDDPVVGALFEALFNHLGQARPNHLGVTTLWLSGAFLATSVCCPGQPPFPAIFPGARCPREPTTATFGRIILINYILASHGFPTRSWCRNVSPRVVISPVWCPLIVVASCPGQLQVSWR